MAAAAATDVERWRVFIAIALPARVQAKLQAPIDGLDPLHEWVRANSADRVHLTLHFLGHLPVAEVEALRPKLDGAVGRHRSFGLAAQGVGAFPNVGRAQVLWAGIGGSDLEQLTALRVDVGKVLVHAGQATQERFHPHLTLARVRKPIRGPARKLLNEWHARWREARFGTFKVTDVRLMRSQLGSGPPRYSTIATFSLQ